MIELNFQRADNLHDAVDNLYNIITLLRSPEGCPWDRIQTNKTATESLIDESYEYLDAIINKDIATEREEIGDVMINVFMNLYIHEENMDFKPYEAINEVCEKLIRRHPHVFGSSVANDANEVLSLWNSVKENVEGHKEHYEDFFSHIPSSLDPLLSSYEIQKKLKKVGFDFSSTLEILDKIKEETMEVETALTKDNKEEIEKEIGDLLFSVVNLSRYLKIKPNVALFRANNKIKKRFQRVFDRAKELNIPLDKEHNKEMNDIWEDVKKEEDDRD